MTDRQIRWGRKGYLFTISIIILITLVILLVMFYTTTKTREIEDTSGRIRCDELYYFVQDIEHDLERAMLIFGRRAAIYAVGDVVDTNRTMANYTYQNCTDFIFDGNGSEAAIAELVLCGSLYGENVTYMVNHTLPVWLERVDAEAREMRFQLDITVLNLTVVPYDAWDFAMMLEMNVEIQDETGLCYYIVTDDTLLSITDIIGLEDPLYPIHTDGKAKKYIYNCDPNVSIGNLAGCSINNWGNGTGTGYAVFVSDIGLSKLKEFCLDPSAFGYDLDQKDIILIYDQAFGACNQVPEECFDITSPTHLAGLIDYAKNSPNKIVEECNVTVPWISATGEIDNVTKHGTGWTADCGGERVDISERGMCIMIKNIGECDIHRILLSYNSEDINTTCYIVSNIMQYWPNCLGEAYPNGPSFFDRLDGRLNLSQKYVDQAVAYFGNEYVGIETLVSLYHLDNRGVTLDTSATWVDYLYWAGKIGYTVMGVCDGEGFEFKLDCPHAYYYNLDTENVSAAGVPPVSVIFSPNNDSLFEGCPAVNITGGADDCDGDVAKVEVGINGVWYNTTLQYNTTWVWNYTLIPEETDKYLIQSRATDSDGIIEDPSESAVVFVVNCTGGDNDPPTAPTLLSPTENETGVSWTPTFFWNPSSDASGVYRYRMEIDLDPADFFPYEHFEYSWGTELTIQKVLNNNRWYAWRVRAQDNAGNWGGWSEVWTFKT